MIRSSRNVAAVPAAPAGLAALAALAMLAAFAAGCGGDDAATNPPAPPPPPSFTVSELLAAPLDLKFDGITYEVEVELWRDFMPPSEPDGRPMAAFALVTAVGALDWPAEITTLYVYVVKDGEVWASKMERDASGARPANQRLYVARDGPKWGPGITVDVVIGIRTTNGVIHLVRTPDVLIRRSD
ncbi:MAG TPA: hypothetical protein VFT32_08660 [Candidatus Eisenbacteria bacterium]|nr:hypothetical protein [Candidatus Eisenbacteria bacterium]